MSKIITFPFEVTPITLISDRFLSGADLAKRLGVNPNVEKAHLIAAGLPEDIADSILFIINDGALPAQRFEMELALRSNE